MGFPGGIFGSIAASAGAAADIATELTSFTKFKQRVDELIHDLKGSPAGAQHVGQEALARHQFGGGDGAWGDAAGVFTSYQSVIKDLESLSRLLSDSMDGMGIAVVASHKGYQHIDEHLRDRVKRIHAETTKHYDERPPGDQLYGKDPYAKYEHSGHNSPSGTGHGHHQPPEGQPPADGADKTKGSTGTGGSSGGAI